MEDSMLKRERENKGMYGQRRLLRSTTMRFYSDDVTEVSLPPYFS